MSNNSPNIERTAFHCPHCNVLTGQNWYSLRSKQLGKNNTPNIWTETRLEALLEDEEIPEEAKKVFYGELKKLKENPIFLSSETQDPYTQDVRNLSLSECYICSRISLWLGDKLIFPDLALGILPNPDMPQDIRNDFEEARAVFNKSPRSSAALLRLCVQKLCSFLNASGDGINEQIKDLISKGLDKKIEKALDIVRVVGNNAVHPGEIDLQDNPAAAESLFGLVNMIATEMITRPKELEELYNSLPTGALESIEARNKKISGTE